MNEIIKAISLLNDMVHCGESHSKQSLEQNNRAVREFELLKTEREKTLNMLKFYANLRGCGWRDILTEIDKNHKKLLALIEEIEFDEDKECDEK